MKDLLACDLIAGIQPKTTKMNPQEILREQIAQACDSLAFVCSHIQSAHTTALQSGNEFAGIAVFSALQQVNGLRSVLKQLLDAANLEASEINQEVQS